MCFYLQSHLSVAKNKADLKILVAAAYKPLVQSDLNLEEA